MPTAVLLCCHVIPVISAANIKNQITVGAKFSSWRVNVNGTEQLRFLQKMLRGAGKTGVKWHGSSQGVELNQWRTKRALLVWYVLAHGSTCATHLIMRVKSAYRSGCARNWISFKLILRLKGRTVSLIYRPSRRHVSEQEKQLELMRKLIRSVLN